ncbi:MAG: hypothetical protein ACYDB7_12930 [Mycobacteriales bacterium]
MNTITLRLEFDETGIKVQEVKGSRAPIPVYGAALVALDPLRSAPGELNRMTEPSSSGRKFALCELRRTRAHGARTPDPLLAMMLRTRRAHRPHRVEPSEVS